MNKLPLVVDDFLPGIFLNILQDKILASTLPWYYYDFTTNYRKDGLGDRDVPLCIHDICIVNISMSDLHNILFPFFYYMDEQLNFRLEEIHRIRANMTFKTEKSFPLPPHVDRSSNDFVFIFYLNDTDGDTILYNEKAIDTGPRVRRLTDVSIYRFIKPKANRLVIFEGDRFHSSSTSSTANRRVLLNFNVSGQFK